MKYRPLAPLVCLNRIPAASVTSVIRTSAPGFSGEPPTGLHPEARASTRKTTEENAKSRKSEDAKPKEHKEHEGDAKNTKRAGKGEEKPTLSRHCPTLSLRLFVFFVSFVFSV